MALSSLPSFSLPRRPVKTGSASGAAASEARIQQQSSASSSAGIAFQQGAFELPPLQAAVVLEAAKASFFLRHAAAADLLEKAADVVFFLVADEVRFRGHPCRNPKNARRRPRCSQDDGPACVCGLFRREQTFA